MEPIFFQNHRGDKICLTEWPIMIQDEGELLRIERSFTALSEGRPRERVIRWDALPRDIELTVSIMTSTEAAFYDAIDSMRSVFDVDLAENKPGRFLWGQSYLTAYVTGRAPEDFDPDMYASDYKITAHLTRGLWTTENTNVFLPVTAPAPAYLVDVDGFYLLDADGYYLTVADTSAQPGISALDGFSYPHRYPYKYAPKIKMTAENGAPGASAFIMRIYGPASLPTVTINGNTYGVRQELLKNDILTINSAERTVTLVRANGQTEDVFRHRGEKLFQPLPAGQLFVERSGEFGVDLIIIEERGEPKWRT